MVATNLSHLFKTLGLTDTEYIVYKALFSLEIATAAEISKTAGTKRPNTYNILKSLQNLGLITSFTENKKLYFRTLGVNAINNHLAERINTLKQQQESLTHVQKELNNIRASTSKSEKDPIVFEGKTAALQVWYDMLNIEEGSTIYDIEAGHNSLIFPDTDPDTHKKLTHSDVKTFARERIKKKIHVNFISTSPPHIDSELEQEGLMHHTNAVYIPKNFWPWPIEIGVYNNKFYYVTYEEKPRAVVVENKILTEAFLQLFNTFRAWTLKQKGVKNIVRY